MMKCIIIEDQLPAQRILRKYIEDIGTLDLVGVYSDAMQAIADLNRDRIDLMFLDIHLPKLSGIDFLKSLNDPPQVILTTAFQEFALEGYELNVVDYLLKPFSFQRFVKAVGKVRSNSSPTPAQIEQLGTTGPDEIFLKSGYDHVRVVKTEIIYLHSDSDYTEIHLEAKKHLSSEPLKYWEDRLDKKHFARIHKSYVVNVSMIHKVSGNQIILSNGQQLPIGRSYKNEFIERYIQ